ncbi:GMP synthase [glutamine-hydrolyzing] [Serratia marcescens]|uniref:GMP synthase [glutamine-hydrolyzing] n=1 Tax=Serratia marcescens TaxID=615 RepID=A0A379YTZ2_SERMA|nr:GMP synthase [glutamine-hydrolyzing] [Serratia marcescens]
MTQNIHKHRILILDFGSQYTQLVARRVREIGVYCELWAWDVSEAQIREFNPSGIILSGGPESTTEAGSPRAPDYVFNAGVPVLGVCYGMQTMAMQLGGHVQGSNETRVRLRAGGKSSMRARCCATSKTPSARPANRCWTCG